MTADDTPRERLARVETKVEHVEATLGEMRTQLSDVHRVITEARGGWKALVITGTIASAVTTLILKALPFLSGWPK